MHYDPNYRNQFFYDSSNSIGLGDMIDILRREIAVSKFKTKMPKGKRSKILLYSLLGVSILVLTASAVIWIVTKSALFTMVMFIIMAFFSVGIMAVVALISDGILRRNCSEPTEATCIGYSISGGGDSDSHGNRILKSPVFEYEYHGFKYRAFDGVYDNFSGIPSVSDKMTILVNPSDPEDIVWNFGKKRQVFLILAAGFAFVLSMAVFVLIIQDENFMSAAFSTTDEVTDRDNPDYSESEWFFVKEEATDEVKNATDKDEFICAEVKENGASRIFSTKEYELEVK